MKTNIIRVLLMLLCCCMILGAFAGCQTPADPNGKETGETTGKDDATDPDETGDETPTTEEETTEEPETEPVEDLPDVQYNKEFVMYMRKSDFGAVHRGADGQVFDRRRCRLLPQPCG